MSKISFCGKMEIEIRNCTRQVINKRIIKKAIFETVKFLKLENSVKLSVVLVGDKKMRSLNKSWRNKDCATDVLSFNFSEAQDGRIEGGEIGEIIICLPYAKRQARQLGISEDKNIALLSAHGTIHIFGIDHERSEKESKKTDEIQEKVLEALEK